MAIFDELREKITTGAKVILPKELEYKFGITEKPEPMEFRVGEGMTPEATERARRVLKNITAVEMPDLTSFKTLTTRTLTDVVQSRWEENSVREVEQQIYKARNPKRYEEIKDLIPSTIVPGGKESLVKSGELTEEEARIFSLPEIAPFATSEMNIIKPGQMSSAQARQILNVGRKATKQEIKSAFSKQVTKSPLREKLAGIAKQSGRKELDLLKEARELLIKGVQKRVTKEPVRYLTGKVKSPYTPKPKKVKAPNLENIQSTNDIKNIIKTTANDYKGVINKSRRGVVTHTETKELADALNLTTGKLFKRTKGKALNAEELTAARNLLVNSAENVSKLAKEARDAGSPEALVNFRKALDRHVAIQKEVQGASAEAGRALEALKIKAKPQRTKAEFYKKVLEATGGEELTEEMAKKVAMIDTSDFLAMNKFLANISKAKTTDKVFEFWVNSILSNPQTHLVNILSNSLVRLSTPAERGIAAGLDLLRQPIPGTKQERYLGEVAADIVGMGHGFAEGARRAVNIWTTGLPPDAITKLEVAKRQAIKGKKGEIIRTPGKFLIAADEFFKALNSQAELYTQAYRKAAQGGFKGKERIEAMSELINDPTPDMLDASKAQELYKTFQKPLGKSGKALSKLRTNTPGLKYIIPFLRTPINIAKYGIERTPLNFLATGYQRMKGAYKGGDFVEELAKPVMGAVISSLVAYHYSQGKITGHAPVDKEERDAFYREGKLPYSVKVGDTWYSYQRLEPLGTVVGMTADFLQDFNKVGEEERDEMIRAITSSVTQNIVNKTYMSGLSNFFNALNDPVRYGGNWIEQLASGFVPQFMKVPVSIVDPYYRRPNGIIEAWKRKIPGMSEDVAPVRNVWGERAEKEGGAFWRSIIPIKKAKSREDEVDKELKSLDYQMGFPSKTVSGNFKLDSQHYDYYQSATGWKIKGMLNKLVAMPQYKNLPREGKIKMIDSVVNGTRDRFRKEMTFSLFVDQMNVDIPATISQEKAAAVFWQLTKEDWFKELSNEDKREYYIKNLDKVIRQ